MDCLDDIDECIFVELVEYVWVIFVEIGYKVSLFVLVVKCCVDWMFESGVIKGFIMVVDCNVFGWNIEVYV